MFYNLPDDILDAFNNKRLSLNRKSELKIDFNINNEFQFSPHMKIFLIRVLKVSHEILNRILMTEEKRQDKVKFCNYGILSKLHKDYMQNL